MKSSASILWSMRSDLIGSPTKSYEGTFVQFGRRFTFSPSRHFSRLRDVNFNQSNAFGAPYPNSHPSVSLK